MSAKFKKPEGWMFWSSLPPTITEFNGMKYINVEVFLIKIFTLTYFSPDCSPRKLYEGQVLSCFCCYVQV